MFGPETLSFLYLCWNWSDSDSLQPQNKAEALKWLSGLSGESNMEEIMCFITLHVVNLWDLASFSCPAYSDQSMILWFN